MNWEVVSLPGGAAGSGITYQLPGGERSRIGSLAFQVSCIGGGAPRQVFARLRDGLGAHVFAVSAPGTHASGLAVVYSFAPDVPMFGTAATFFMGGPFLGGWLPPNIELSVVVLNAGVGDTIFDGRMVVAQYPVIESAEA